MGNDMQDSFAGSKRGGIGGEVRRIEKKCLFCGGKFVIPRCRDSREHCCSSECKKRFREQKKAEDMLFRKRECDICGNIFYPRKEQITAGQGKYCSIKCRGKGVIGENNPMYGKSITDEQKQKWRDARDKNNSWLVGQKNPNYKGGSISQGYLKIGRKYAHRIIASEMFGVTLTENDVVHHINGDKLDNRRENIEITNRSIHAKIHFPDRIRDKNGRFR